MKEIIGNILDVKEGIIVQQANCKGAMGAGLTKQVRVTCAAVVGVFKLCLH